MTEEPVEVIQADIDARTRFYDDCRAGMEDDDLGLLDLAFARHRVSHSAEKQALIEALEEAERALVGMYQAIARGDAESGERFAASDPAVQKARSTLLSMRNRT